MSITLKFDRATAVRSLLDATSYERNLDRKLQIALETSLAMLRSEALLVCYGDLYEELALTNANSDKLCELSSSGLLKAIQNKLPAITDVGELQGVVAFEFNNGPHIFVPCKVRAADEWGQVLDHQPVQFVLFSFGDSTSVKGLEELLNNAEIRSDLDILARTICFAVRMRSKIYSRFPKSFRKAYWNQALASRNMINCDAQVPQIAPPWSAEDSIGDTATGLRSTITLSFDLRRSTRAMEKTLDLKAYADWIETMVLVLHRIAVENNGVFDKFTGDGALVHFLVGECNLFPFDRPILAGLEQRVLDENEWRTSASKHGHRGVADALACGFEMLWAIEEHSKRLQQITRVVDRKFGPAAAIAKGDVQWSVDRDGNPIVVGLSVVDACRFTDVAERNVVCVSPHVNQLLKEAGVLAEYEAVDFRGKETDETDDLFVLGYREPPEGLCRPRKKITDLLFQIRGEVDKRASFGLN